MGMAGVVLVESASFANNGTAAVPTLRVRGLTGHDVAAPRNTASDHTSVFRHALIGKSVTTHGTTVKRLSQTR